MKWTVCPFRHITGYVKKQKLFKKRLDACLNELKPDITISTLRRDINIINNMTDGSIKLGEIHFNKSNYRELSDKPLPRIFEKVDTKLLDEAIDKKTEKAQKIHCIKLRRRCRMDGTE